MPTTPNYGWDTPADTDYVTNGALSIRTMANDADATVYSVDQAKVAKAGDTMTGALLVPMITVNGRAIGLLHDAGGDAVIQFLNNTGTTQQGFIQQSDDNTFIIGVTGNTSQLSINATGNTTRTVSGEDRPIAFAMQCGTATVGANSSASITLDSGRFTFAPIVFATPNSVTSSAITWHVGSSTTSGFTLYNTSASSRDFYWQAIQMLSSSAAG